jgi:hypothetical protein
MEEQDCIFSLGRMCHPDGNGIYQVFPTVSRGGKRKMKENRYGKVMEYGSKLLIPIVSIIEEQREDTPGVQQRTTPEALLISLKELMRLLSH